jgi:preprotein translocase subunit SecG
MDILLAIHVLVTVLLILVVLIQKNEGGSSLFASGGGGNMFNARGTSSILTKATWTLATLFLANCVIMATIASHSIRTTQTLLDHPLQMDEEQEGTPSTRPKTTKKGKNNSYKDTKHKTDQPKAETSAQANFSRPESISNTPAVPTQSNNTTSKAVNTDNTASQTTASKQ